MTEILTESFCERCGTRYTFESAAPRRSRLGRVRTLSKGMKNFVLSDDASFSEAMAEARSDEEFAAVSHQLDAFHQTFNFCLTCRQYTCGDCWNTVDGRCLTCAPVPGMEEPSFAAAAFVDAVPAPVEVTNGGEDIHESWPDADFSAARLSRALGLDEAEAEATAEADGVDDARFDLSAAIGAAAAVAATSAARADERDDERDDEPLASQQPGAETPPGDELVAQATPEDHERVPAVQGVAPGQSLEDAVAEYEARIAAEEAAARAAVEAEERVEAERIEVENERDVQPELVDGEPDPVAVAVEPEPIAREPEPVPLVADAAPVAVVTEPQPEAVVAEPEAVVVEPEPVAAEPEPVATEPEPVAAVADDAAAPLAIEPPVAAEAQPEPAVPAIAAASVVEAAGDGAEPSRDDVVAQPTWPQRAPTPAADVAAPAPDAPAAPQAAPWLTVAPEESDSPQWPVAPAFPASGSRREMPMTLAGRPLLPQADPSGLWAASAREVLTAAAQAPTPTAAPAPTAQPCVSCGLSLSANARFCRRCGTRQA